MHENFKFTRTRTINIHSVITCSQDLIDQIRRKNHRDNELLIICFDEYNFIFMLSPRKNKYLFILTKHN